MVKDKKYCSIHHFNYIGGECPFCLQDRLSNIIKKIDKNITKKDEVSSLKKEDNKIKKEKKINKSMNPNDIRDLLSTKFNVGKL